MSNNNNFLSGLAFGAAAVGIPLVTVGMCASNRLNQDKKLVKAVSRKIADNPQKLLQVLEVLKELKSSDAAKIRNKAKEFIND